MVYGYGVLGVRVRGVRLVVRVSGYGWWMVVRVLGSGFEGKGVRVWVLG
jgi:hypothetical protein